MRINVKINHVYDTEHPLKAFATVFLDKRFAITGVRVIACKKGLCVMMPTRVDSMGSYRDVCFPITKDCREQMNEAVLKAYEEYLIRKEELENKEEKLEKPRS